MKRVITFVLPFVAVFAMSGLATAQETVEKKAGGCPHAAQKAEKGDCPYAAQKAEKGDCPYAAQKAAENADRKCKDGGEPPCKDGSGPGNAVGKGPRGADCPYKDGAKCKDGSEPPCKDGTGPRSANCLTRMAKVDARRSAPTPRPPSKLSLSHHRP